jgi:hypothetical protein
MIIEFKRIGLINPEEFSLASRATLEEGRKWLDKKLGATLNAKQNAYRFPRACARRGLVHEFQTSQHHRKDRISQQQVLII